MTDTTGPGTPGEGTPGGDLSGEQAASPRRARGHGHRNPHPARPYRIPPLTALRAAAPRTAAHNARWWFAVIWGATAVLVAAIVLHLTWISGMQHNRAQVLAFNQLRTSLAKGEAPVSPLGLDGQPVPLGTPVAFIEIPRIGLKQVVVEGTTSDVLRGAPGHRRDTVTPGQAGTSVIFGRESTYGAPFARIGQLAVGDQIRVWTGQGEQVFEVFGLRRDGDPLPPALAKGEARLELVTANGFALFPSGGLYLDAQLIGQAQQTPARIMTTTALPPGEVAMGVDFVRARDLLTMLVVLGVAGYGVVVVWRRWGQWPAWAMGTPVIVTLIMLTGDTAAGLLPNLL